MIRLVAIDIDGTLLTSRHEVTQATAEAIARVRSRGVQVVLTTSRPPRAVWPILGRRLGLLEPEVFIASQGALTGSYDAAGRLRVLDRQPMPAALARQVVAAAGAAGLSVNWYAAERWLVAVADERIREEADIVGCAPEVADLTALDVGPDKLLLLGPPDGPEIAGRIAVPDGLVALASTHTHLEVTRSHVDKADALARVCRGRGIEAADVMAIGDGRNDLAMLAFAGTAVAPANAHPEVLAAADLVVPGNDQDGVAQALTRLVP